MTVVRMTEAHIGALAALECACFSHPWSEQALRDELDNPTAVFFVAVGEDGAVRGYVGMHHILDEADITNVAVFPAARRQGVGRALIQAVADYAAKQALVRVTLEVRASNAAAIALYEGFGFVQDGRRPRFYSDPTEDALLYSRYTLR